jgi:YHS domain-containing protein
MTGEPIQTEGTAWETADRRVADFAQFARAHLRNPAERTAYLALAGTPDEVWSASAIARRSRADIHDVDVALRRFAAAGIAEATGASATGERLYRWHTTMAYLHAGDRGDSGAVDPVCGMPVPADGPYTETTDGEDLRFCSLRCQMAWRAASRGT